VLTGPVGVDLGRVRQRKRDVVASFRGSSEKRLESASGLDYICGEATFTGSKTLAVEPTDGDVNARPRAMTAAQIIIDTGSRPQRPPLPGLDRVTALDSTSIMELDEVPEHLLVLGGGYVGLEFAQMFRRFGSRVTIVQRGKQLLAREDADVAEAVAQVLREDGIEILLNADARGVQAGPSGGVRLSVSSPDGEREWVGSHLLLAAGRAPNSETLNLPATGITPDKRGFIPVNDRLETVVPGIYALGDVNGNPAFTHISYDDYRILRTNLIEGGQASTKGRPVPYVVFIDPQLGRIGLSESEARAQGKQIKVAKMPMTSVARALEVDESRGFMKAVVDAATGEILGAAILSLEGGEIMSMLEIAMLGKVPYTLLREAIFAHPTLAEALNNLFGAI
jgi:pyruvate/2-oxoglutarate dehydrogenase complex dihydrolipoamide dehydrogenase (E3) component